MKVVAIVQARMGSSRLPGKIMLDLVGKPMIERVMERLARSRNIHECVMATTQEPADDVVERLCLERKWPCFRGSEQDVLDRYYRAAVHYQASAVVRITSDCPLIDPALVDSVIEAFLIRQPTPDYAVTQGFPRGLDTEIFTMEALAQAWREAKEPASREHVTAHLYRHPSEYQLFDFSCDRDLSHLRWTVDTIEDFRLVELIFRHFDDRPFSWREVLDLIDKHPNWGEINRHVQQKQI